MTRDLTDLNQTPASLHVTTENGWLEFRFDKQHAAYSSEKALAAISAMNALYGISKGVDNDSFFLANNRRHERVLLVGATDILAQHGFVADDQKEAFVRDIRTRQLRGHAGLMLDGYLGDHAALMDTAKPVLNLMANLAQNGDMGLLPTEDLHKMRAIADEDVSSLTLKRMVPPYNWQADFYELCKNYKPEIEAAIRQEHTTVEIDAQGNPLVKNAVQSPVSGHAQWLQDKTGGKGGIGA